MKVVQFTVPVAKGESVVVQEDILPYFYNYLHRHVEAQITLIIKGEGTLIAGNYTQPFKAGEVYVIGANQPHIFKGDAIYFENIKTKNIHAIHVYFNYDNTLSHLSNVPELEAMAKFISLTPNSLQLSPDYEKQAAIIIKKIAKSTGFDRLVNFMNLLHLFSDTAKNWKSLSTGFSKYTFTDSEGIRMNNVYQYTIENYSENITLSKISSIAHITKHAFCKYFKKHTRKTYFCFLNEVRINEACKKIIKGNFDSIASIAYATGFNNAISFNRVFKKTTGMSPTDYIKEYKFKEEHVQAPYHQ